MILQCHKKSSGKRNPEPASVQEDRQSLPSNSEVTTKGKSSCPTGPGWERKAFPCFSDTAQLGKMCSQAGPQTTSTKKHHKDLPPTPLSSCPRLTQGLSQGPGTHSEVTQSSEAKFPPAPKISFTSLSCLPGLPSANLAWLQAEETGLL